MDATDTMDNPVGPLSLPTAFSAAAAVEVELDVEDVALDINREKDGAEYLQEMEQLPLLRSKVATLEASAASTGSIALRVFSGLGTAPTNWHQVRISARLRQICLPLRDELDL